MYVIDANVLIEAKNRYYAFDIAPGFWSWLERAQSTGDVCSIEPVRDELLSGKDELADWAKTTSGFFCPVDKAAVGHFPDLAS